MDWNRVEGNWKQVKGKVKEQWGKLTDDDLDVIRIRERPSAKGSERLVRSSEVVILEGLCVRQGPFFF